MKYDIAINKAGISLCQKNDDGRLMDIGYNLPMQKIDTEQKILAWVLHFTTKGGMTVDVIQKFINGCKELVHELDVHSKN